MSGLRNGETCLLTIGAAETSFHVRRGELILDAALRQDVFIPYSCRNGTCRTCLYKVTEGEVIQENADVCMISEQEMADNLRLICMSTAASDATLEKPLPRRRRMLAEQAKQQEQQEQCHEISGGRSG